MYIPIIYRCQHFKDHCWFHELAAQQWKTTDASLQGNRLVCGVNRGWGEEGNSCFFFNEEGNAQQAQLTLPFFVLTRHYRHVSKGVHQNTPAYYLYNDYSRNPASKT